MTAPRPNKGQIYEMYRMAAAHFSKLHSDMKMSELFEHLEYGGLLTGLIDGYTPRLPPTAPIAVNTLVDHILLGERPEVKMSMPPGVNVSDTVKGYLEIMEGWVKEMMAKVDRALGESPRRDFVSQTANPGMGTLVYTLDFDKYPERPVRNGETASEWRKKQHEYHRARSQAFPVDIRSAPPTTIFPDPAHDPPHWVIEVRERQRREFGELPWITDGKPYEHGKMLHEWRGQTIEVEELIYCSPDWYGIYHNQHPYLTDEQHDADDEGVAPNPTGKLWYKHALNGLGKNDSRNRPEYKIIGLLRWAWDTLIMEAEAINQVNMIRGHMSSGSWDVSHPDGAERAKELMRANPIRIGDITYRDSQLVIGALAMPVLHPAVLDTLGIIQNLVDLALGASLLRGIGTAGDAAAKYRTMLAEARLKFAATRESCQQAEEGMWTDILEMIRDNAERFKDGLGHRGKTLKPEMIPYGFICTITYQPTTAEEKAFKLEQGLQLLKAGPNGGPAISMSEFLGEYASVADPIRALKEMAKDQIRQQLIAFAGTVAVQVATQRLQQKLPGLFPELAMAQQQAAAPPMEPTLQAGPGGFTQPGEQPVAPAVGTSQDLLAQRNGMATLPPQIAGVR